jgi:hypothetical protein
MPGTESVGEPVEVDPIEVVAEEAGAITRPPTPVVERSGVARLGRR